MKKSKVSEIASFLNAPINTLIFFRNPPRDGELYGLELEVEGQNVQMGKKAVKGWTQVEEGSLRARPGNETTEYIFSAPCSREEAEARVTRLFNAFERSDVILRQSYRTSTHVHMNFGDRTVKNLALLFVLYTIIEEVLQVYCGESRRGNVFCLPNRDAEDIVNMFSNSLLKFNNLNDFKGNIRYCGFNMASLFKFGTIEFRLMRGADNPQMVIDWLGILHEMYQYVIDHEGQSPAKLIEQLSFDGSDAWLRKIFSPDAYDKLMETWNISGNDLHRSLYQGVRLVQLLSYGIEEAFQIPAEDLPSKAKIKIKNPFGENAAIGGDRDHSRIHNGTGLEYTTPVRPGGRVIHGLVIEGIRPKVIQYSGVLDRWMQLRDGAGNAFAIPRPWFWQDEDPGFVRDLIEQWDIDMTVAERENEEEDD
jgi:hypothetical protein